MNDIIVLNTRNTIFLPLFLYIISITAPSVILKYRERINYKHFCLFIAFITIETIVIYAFLNYWVRANIGTMKEIEVIFSPWDVGVRVITK